jgi:hypothetical protein
MTKKQAIERTAEWWTQQFQLGIYWNEDHVYQFGAMMQQYIKRLLDMHAKCYDPVLGYVEGCQIYVEESDIDLDALWESINPQITSFRHGPKYTGSRITLQSEGIWFVRVKRGHESSWELFH